MEIRKLVIHHRLGLIKDLERELRIHGFPKELMEEAVEILKNDKLGLIRDRKKGPEALEETVETLSILLRDWQRRKHVEVE